MKQRQRWYHRLPMDQRITNMIHSVVDMISCDTGMDYETIYDMVADYLETHAEDKEALAAFRALPQQQQDRILAANR